MPVSTKPKAVGYIRVSTAEQAEHGESLRTQRAEIKRYCTFKGFELVDICEDAGISGAKEQRPGFNKAMAMAEEGKLQVLVIARFSRLARNARHLLNTYHQLQNLGITLHSIADGFTGGDTAQSRFLLQMLAAVSELERETIREQMLTNKMARWTARTIFNGKPPFGYTWDKEAKRLAVVPAQADLYQRIVALYLEAGKSLRDIVLELAREGVLWFKRNGHLDKSILTESEVSYEQRWYPATIHPAVQG